MILIFLGLLVMIFAFPKIRQPIMARLMNEGLITPKRVKPEDAEIIKYAGPSISIFAIGFITFLIGLIITLF